VSLAIIILNSLTKGFLQLPPFARTHANIFSRGFWLTLLVKKKKWSSLKPDILYPEVFPGMHTLFRHDRHFRRGGWVL